MSRRDSKEPEIAAQFVDAIRSQQKVLRLAKDALEVLWQARGGGPIAYGLAAASAIGAVADAAFPPETPWEALNRQGLRLRHSALAAFMSRMLLRVEGAEEVAKDDDDGERALVWRDASRRVKVGLLVSPTTQNELYVHPDGGLTLLAELLVDVWHEGRELTLVRSATNGGIPDINVVPMAEPGPYVGARGPEWYAERLSRYPPGPRTILLRGRSGVGKSVLARHVCRIVGGDDYRLLKVPSSVLPFCRADEVLELVLTLRPTMLLLDDVEFEGEQLDQHLSLFETLRVARSLIFVTMMTEDPDDEPKPGSFYLSGMRPGRIDEVHHLSLPDPDGRRELLLFYAAQQWPDGVPDGFDVILDALVERTAGMSGAYLSALVERIGTHGIDSWEVELDQVRWSSPAPQGPASS